MEAVKADADWPLSFPITVKEQEADGIDLSDSSSVLWRDFPVSGRYVTNDEGLVACKISKVIKAKRRGT